MGNVLDRDSKALLLASSDANLQIVDKLLKDNLLSEYSINRALIEAVYRNHLHIVAKLLEHPKADATVNNNEILRVASSTGNTELLELICGWKVTKQKGNESIVLKSVDPTANENEALRFATSCGHINFVKMLLEKTVVTDEAKDDALIIATTHKKTDIFKLLFENRRIGKFTRMNSKIIATKQGDTSLSQIIDSYVEPPPPIVEEKIDIPISNTNINAAASGTVSITSMNPLNLGSPSSGSSQNNTSIPITVEEKTILDAIAAKKAAELAAIENQEKQTNMPRSIRKPNQPLVNIAPAVIEKAETSSQLSPQQLAAQQLAAQQLATQQLMAQQLIGQQMGSLHTGAAAVEVKTVELNFK